MEKERPAILRNWDYRGESSTGYDSSYGRRNSGWLPDDELRNFNVAQVRRTIAMINGRWVGSYDTNKLYSPSADSRQDWSLRTQGLSKAEAHEISCQPTGFSSLQLALRASMGLCGGARHGYGVDPDPLHGGRSFQDLAAHERPLQQV